MSRMQSLNLKRALAVAALGLIAVLTVSPAQAATCALANTAPTATTNAVVTPQMIQWNIFETNIGSYAKCQALLTKMQAAYPPTYHWLCESYQTQTCPSYTRWALFFGENGI